MQTVPAHTEEEHTVRQAARLQWGGTQGPMHCPVRESYSILKGRKFTQRKLELQADMCKDVQNSAKKHLRPKTYGKEPSTLHSTGTQLQGAQLTLTA